MRAPNQSPAAWPLQLCRTRGANNLKKVLQGIMSYYNEFLGQQISEELIPGLNQITEYSDSVELGRLLQLILGCAVNCEKKQEHIQTIMTLEESVQHVVMTAIQELMSKEILSSPTNDAVGELEQQLKRTLEELQEALAEKEELRQRCQELDMQVTVLQDEKNSLVSENEMMNEKLDQLDESFDDPNTMVAKKYFHAHLQLEQLQEENFREDEVTEPASFLSAYFPVLGCQLEVQKINELGAALQKKEEDMKAMEERYKMYLEKARNVIKTLDPKLNPASAEIMLLRKQLAEEERRIEILESECKVAKFHDYEEKLIVSAWYNKSLAFQKLGMESRLVSGSGACKDTGACTPARSFLAQQRHITNTRRNLSVKVPATTSD
ncbi:protein Hook homolog 1-like [Manis javanica]|uniref:protein Hook homolog 1-like n=1 Tax=Manis javanica TaxID=9974 RepID=UPI003C6D385E